MVWPLSSDNTIDGPAEIEAQAMLYLGRLDGALEHCGASTLRIFAARLIRHTLTSALQQEGHTFTEPRFDAWFAGLVTLSDDLPRHARPPRVICETILTELSHNTWAPLAHWAVRIKSALLAPLDLEAHDGHHKANGITIDARQLVNDMLAHANFSPSNAPALAPLASLAALYRKVAQSAQFAPAERASTAITFGNRQVTIEHGPAASPLWAIETLYGKCWLVSDALRHPLPLPGLIRLEALNAEDTDQARSIRATALRDIMHDFSNKLRNAAQAAERIAHKLPGQRGTSRAPAVYELLAGFGAMRSAQIESVIGATRLGVRGMLASLDTMGIISRTTVSGAHLYGTILSDQGSFTALHCGENDQASFSFSAPALDDFEASMASLDKLLERTTEAAPYGDDID